MYKKPVDKHDGVNVEINTPPTWIFRQGQRSIFNIITETLYAER